MAEHQRRPRSGNRHVNKTRAWNPDTDLYDEALQAVKEGLSWTMVAWLTECLKYVTGRRKTFPPRSAEAEARAALLPDDDPIRPEGDIDT